LIEFEVTFRQSKSTVRIAKGLLSEAGAALAEAWGRRPVLVVSDGHVAPLYASGVVRSLESAGLEATIHVVPPGDETKSLIQASALYDRLAAGGFGRDSVVLALGGGMVSDLAGFVAATWMRGIGFVICPTTLESAIDACLGGKTAVNHPAGKNLIGAFHQPRLVLIDPATLRSLPDRDLAAGLAESIKHAVIREPGLLEWQGAHLQEIRARDGGALEELIARNLRIKADIVSQDERETRGLREILNFGHTIGHAIEAWSRYERRHGECVALGMVAACRLSVLCGLLDESDEQALREAIAAAGLPTDLGGPAPVEELRRYLAMDKKAAGGRTRFVLLNGLGNPVVRDDVAEEAMGKAVAALAGK